MLFAISIALLTSCCVAKTSEPQAQCTLYRDGKSVAIADADSLVQIVTRILNSCDDQLLLIVSPDLITQIKASDVALETVFPQSITATSPNGSKRVVSKVLLPLSGDYGAPEDLAYAVVFSGEKSYVTPAWTNSNARDDLQKLKTLLK